MRVLPKKAASPVRRAVPEPKPEAGVYTFPAPIMGLVLNENIVTASPGGARVLDNWICTPTGIKARAGSQLYATLPGPVRAMFAYRSQPARLFAATDSGIYDISTAPDPMSATLSLGGRTGGDYSTTMFGTAGGEFLIAANGADPVQLFDGSAWTDAGITGVATDKLSHVWSFANRLFFVEKGTLTAHYLPVDSIGGAVGQVSLSGVFSLGGTLLFGANWSMDASDGMDDKCVFVSTEGEIAVYVGTNPDLYTDWRLEGVYQISRPLGRNAIMKAGGELVIATEAGMVPLSTAISKDPAALASSAVSSRIEPLWRECVGLYDAPWSIAKWEDRGVMLVAMANDATDDVTLCCNLTTGAWSRWTNIGARCLGYFGGYVFAGGNDGTIKRLETGGTDMGDPFVCVYVGAHDAMGAPGRAKTAIQARAIFRAAHDINPQLGVQVDYLTEIAAPPNATVFHPVGAWDIALWDEAVWDSPSTALANSSHWRALGRTGYSIAPEMQLTFGSLAPPQVELVSIDVTYSVGALVA